MTPLTRSTLFCDCMFNNMLFTAYKLNCRMRLLFTCMLFLLTFLQGTAQTVTPVFKDGLAVNRERTYNHIIKNTITKNLSSTINDSTEDRWEDAFYALTLLQKKSAWIDNRIIYAVQGISSRGVSFQRSLLELLYANYPDK